MPDLTGALPAWVAASEQAAIGIATIKRPLAPKEYFAINVINFKIFAAFLDYFAASLSRHTNTLPQNMIVTADLELIFFLVMHRNYIHT